MPHKAKLGRPPKVRPAESYLIAIEAWEWAYSIGAPDPYYREKHGGEAAEEYNSLTITGRIHRPPKLVGKRAEITVYGTQTLNRANWNDLNVKAIGDIDTFPQGGFSVNIRIDIPDERMASCLTMLAAGKWKWVLLSGTPLKQRRGEIHRVAFPLAADLEETSA